MKRVIVCGGRKFNNYNFVCQKLTELDGLYGPFDTIIHGGATGADSAANMWAMANLRVILPFKISHEEWNRFGKSAGPRRNERMLREGKPDGIIAFPGGPGTADMVRRGQLAGLHVIEVSGGASV